MSNATTGAPATKVVTGEVRLSYAHLFEPWSGTGGEPKYSVSLLIKKTDTDTLSRIKAAIEAAKEADKGKWNGTIPADLRMPVRDGDAELASGKKTGDEYAGCYFINVSSKQRPGVVDAALNPVIDPAQAYSGCYARVSINAFGYNANGNQGISFGLNNVQIIRDGEPLGGSTRPEDDFSAFETAGSSDILF